MACKKVLFNNNDENVLIIKDSKSPFKLPSLKHENVMNSNSSTRSNTFQLTKSVSNRISNLKAKCESKGPLTTWEISKYRLSKFQMILSEMLVKGYHRSFSILFNLNKERERMRLEEGPDSTRWKLQSLTLNPNLDQIMEYLCMIEEAQRTNDTAMIMTATNQLALIFGQNAEDSWIVKKFIATELECAATVTSDSGYMKALANLNAGILAAKNGDLLLAAEHLARVFSMAYAHNWKDQNGDSLSKVCSEHLCQVYLKLACQSEKSKPAQMLSYLKQAHEISKESGLKLIEATCCLELGIVFEKLKNIDMAIAYFRGLFEVARSINDQENLGLACEAIGRCYEKQDNRVEAMRYLEKFVTITEKSCDWQEYARACRVLGETFNRYGEYAKSKIAFQNSYQVTYCLNSQGTFNESRILNGVAEGNGANLKVMDHIGLNNREVVERMIQFRSNTVDIDSDIFFDKISEEDVITFELRADEMRENRKELQKM